MNVKITPAGKPSVRHTRRCGLFYLNSTVKSKARTNPPNARANTADMDLKKVFAVIFLVTVAVAVSYAQAKKVAAKTAPVKPAAIPYADDDNSLLWEVSGRQMPHPSYLYGTMHILCAEDARISETLKQAIKTSRQVFFEVDMDDLGQLMSVLKYARMNNGLKIADLVTPVEYARIEAYFAEHSAPIPFSMMRSFKPYFISSMISEGLLDCEQKSSLEQMIMEEAKKGDKEVLGLETIAFQASIFDSIPYEKQARDLVAYVDSIATYKQTTQEMVDIYRKQDIRSLDSLLLKSDPGMMQYMGLLLYDRNRRWADQVVEQAYHLPTLFAVGAGHLGGEKGLINLLRQQGFTVKPLKN